jgi:CheY-like chemotaxis protein
MKVLEHDPGGVAGGTPRSETQVRPTPDFTHADVPTDGRERPLVLVVDDEDSIRLLCRVNLSLENLDTAEAGDGDTALRLARELKPDLVLLDVMMPQVDGWQVAEELGRDAATRELPIVFLSARAEPADYRHAHDLGAVGYVTKPFDPTTLGSVLHEVLERLGRGEREELRRERLKELGEQHET